MCVKGIGRHRDSGAEVSCLPANIGADTYPLHETRFSMCGGHHVAAGGKLHEFGARIFGLEAANVRGGVVDLLVRFRVMIIGKALLSTQKSDPVVVGKRSSQLTLEMRASSGNLRTLASRS